MNENLTTGGYEQTKERLREFLQEIKLCETRHAKQNAFTPKK
jgi:hypothetical protein